MGDERQLLRHQSDRKYTFDERTVTPSDGTGETTKCEEEEKSRSKWKLPLGYFTGLSAAFLLTVGASCAQALGGFIPMFELNALRYLIQFICTVPLVIHNNRQVLPGRRNVAYVGIACLANMTLNLMYYEGSIYLPVTAVGATDVTTVLALSTIMILILREQWYLSLPVSILLSVIGILCLSQPTFLFGYFGYVSPESYTTPVCARAVDAEMPRTFNSSETTSFAQGLLEPKNEDNPTNIDDPIKGYLLIIVSGFAFIAFLFTVTRRLQDLGMEVIIFWVSLSGIVSMTALMFAIETPTIPRTSQCVLLLAGQTAAAAIASTSAMVSADLIPPVVFSLLHSTQMLFFLIAQYTVLQSINPGKGNWLEVTGALVMLCGTICDPAYVMYRHYKDSKKGATAEIGLSSLN